MNNKIKAIIFDCDGVIIDSEYLFLKSTILFFESRKIYLSLDDVLKYVGLPLDVIIKKMIEEYHLNDSIELIENYFKEDDIVYKHPERLRIMNNLEELLVWSKNNNIICAIASSSPKDYVEQVVSVLDINKYFKTIVALDDVKQGKPYPDVYEEVCRSLSVNKKDVIAIEDSPIGIKAAKTAGLYTIAYKGSKVKQDTSAANIVVHDFKEIIKMLEGK